MQDVSAYLRNCFQDMHKKTMEKNYHHRNLRDKMDDYKGVRRQTRDTLLSQRRNIHEKNLSPYITPRPSKMGEHVVKKTVKVENKARPSNNRYEMMMKWKAEKERLKQEEKKKAKPLFKLCHIPVDIGLPNLENVNKEIKGKLIKPNSATFTSKFAPPNHKFCPPENITALNLKIKKQTPLLKKNVAQNSRATRQMQACKNIITKPSSAIKRTPLIHQNTMDRKPVGNTRSAIQNQLIISLKEQFEESEQRGASSSNSAQKQDRKVQQQKKTVDWNNVNVVESDDEVLTKEISDIPKKRYIGTPKKKLAVESGSFSDNSSKSGITVDALKKKKTAKIKVNNKRTLTTDGKVETPKYKHTKVTSDKASTNKSNPARATRRNARIETPWKAREKKDWKTLPKKTNTAIVSHKIVSKSSKYNKDVQKNSSTPISNKKSDKFTPTNKQTLNKETSSNDERETIYSDDEISIKSPRSAKTSTKSPKIPSSTKITIKTPSSIKQKDLQLPIHETRVSIYSDDEISIRTPLKSPKTPGNIKKITKSFLKFSDDESTPSPKKILENSAKTKCESVIDVNLPTNMSKSHSKERESVYSDDEISIRTPNTPASARKSNPSIDTKIVRDIIVLLSPCQVLKNHTKTKSVDNVAATDGVIKSQTPKEKFSDDEIFMKTPGSIKKSFSVLVIDLPSLSPRKISRKSLELEFKTPEGKSRGAKNERRDTIYSDDEISIRTPIKTPKTASKIPRSVKKLLKSTSSNDPELSDDIFIDIKNEKKSKNIENKSGNALKLEMPDNESKSPKTNRKSPGASPGYISPFVTISRGKVSARKEFKIRQSTGGTFTGTPDCKVNFAESTTPKAAADYFTNKLDAQISRLEGVCDVWQAYKDQNDLAEETIDTINVAIGQSKLLIAKKFQQFRRLIEECRSCQYREKPITCQDLHGFWDMIYMQVEDLEKRFANLELLKLNGWQVFVPEKKAPVKKARGRPRKNTASSKLRDVIKAARTKKKEENPDSSAAATVVESKEALAAATPLKDRMSPFRPSSARRSLRVSMLSGQTQKRRASASPGLTMMRISQAIKCGDGLTPSKSILKTDLTRSEKRVTKSVLFNDEVEVHIEEKRKPSAKSVNKENCDLSNLITFSPVQSSRPKRLAKVDCYY